MLQSVNLDFYRALLQAYSEACKPICREIRMPQTAFDILMILANNPHCNFAKDIVAIRGIKANLVSVNVDKLVEEGFLERRPDKDDRRKTILICTELARPVVERGRRFQRTFIEGLFKDIPEGERKVFTEVVEKIKDNLSRPSEEKI